jgi:hypothetical protein
MLRRRLKGELGAILAEMAPRVWPGVPPAVFVGFTAFTVSRTENTTDARADQSFHEVGWFQTEAGPRGGPAPNPDPGADNNSWTRLAVDRDVVALLGRPATCRPGAWRDAPRDQVAVGLVNLRRRLGGLSTRLPEVAPRDFGSLWAVALAFTMFSRGAGQAVKVLRALAPKMVDVPETDRWQTWAETVAVQAAKGLDVVDTREGRKGAAYGWVRTEQKLQSGRLLAEQTDDRAALEWYGRQIAPETASALTRLAYP